MDVFNVAAIQTVSSAELQDNLDQAAALIKQAAKQGAQLVVLPEYFFLMGLHDKDKVAVCEQPGKGPVQDFLRASAKQHGVWLVSGTVPLESPDSDRIYNTSLVYSPQGEQVARYDKIHLFGFRRGQESYDESRTIHPGKPEPQTFQAPCGKVGLSICYDLRFPELYRAFGDVSLIIVPAAFTYTTGSAHWEILLRARAIENQCYVLAAAQGGKHENGRRTWGHSMLIDPWGEVLHCLPEGPGVIVGKMNLSRLAEVREALPALKHRIL